MLLKINMFIIIALVVNCFTAAYAFSESNSSITVYYDKDMGEINKKVFGINFLANDPSFGSKNEKPNKRHTDYGGGVWDPKGNKPVKEVIELARNTGVAIIRIPGAAKRYDWKKAIGKKRKNYLYGLDESLKAAEEIGADTVFTISYFIPHEHDAADLVEYLNAHDDGSNPNGGTDWAAERAKNGRSLPYGVKYFEIGEEVWSGSRFSFDKSSVRPEEYANKYLKYYESMKAVDPSIKLGVVLNKYATRFTWNEKVMQIVKDKLDFGIIHSYPNPEGKNLEKINPLEVYKVTLAIPTHIFEGNYRLNLNLLKKKSGREIPLAVTEYNSLLPFRHNLGNALINAEMLRILMKPDNNILMANHWHFGYGWFAMIKSRYDFVEHDYRKPINYIKRPNYYVYELYHKHFGDTLINAEVRSGSYDLRESDLYKERVSRKVENWVVRGNNVLSEKWEIKSFPGVSAEEKEGILEVNFEDPEKFNDYHCVKHAGVEPGTYYRLSGYIKTEQLVEKSGGIGLEIQNDNGWFKSRSASNTKRIAGTTDWEHVEVLHNTGFNTQSVNVRVRRIGKEGPLSGKVFLRDVKFEKVIPDTYMPYLTVNASKSSDGEKVYLMVINMNMHEAITTDVEIKDFISLENADTWTLHGSSITADNEKISDNVKIRHKSIKINNNILKYSFEPHSLTAIEITGKRKLDEY